MGNYIQDLLRDKPPVMVLDMGLGSREQSLPAHDSEPVRVIGIAGAPLPGTAATAADNDIS